MRKIVIIGGGDIRKLETLRFDKRIVELTGKKKPRALFIPTASRDSDSYVNAFNKVYADKLSCRKDSLLLVRGKPSLQELREKILSSDLIYIGGGNTLMMMKLWRHLGVDILLKEAAKRGIVFAGLSAGGISMFDAGHSDSMSYYAVNTKSWKYVKVTGLGLIKGIHCPHFNGETLGRKRRRDFIAFMKKHREHGNIGIALDNHCAMEFIGDAFRVLSAKKGCNAYKVFRQGENMAVQIIKQSRELTPTKYLYSLE